MGPHALQITHEVHQVGGRGFTAPDDAAAYLVTVGSEAALIDSGCGRATDLLLANIESTGTPADAIRQLLLTHCHFDHTGGAAELRKRTCCRVVAHALDARVIETGDPTISAASWYGDHLSPCPVDRKLDKPREILHIGASPIEAIHIPGHSPGSVAYLFESCVPYADAQIMPIDVGNPASCMASTATESVRISRNVTADFAVS